MNILRRIVTASLLAIVAMLFAGCSSSTPPSAEEKAMEKTELRFSLDQCQPIELNLFKCPAIDKPVCNPDYNGQYECVRIGPKGSVFLRRAF